MMHEPETMGSGCAFIDYDNDGWMDIYLVNSGPCDFYTPPRPLRNALYRNNRDGTFTDVTEKAGVPGNAYGMGVAVGDYDADGFPDLYVTQYPHSILYHNNGDGTFTDVTAKAGVAAPGWSTSAAWFDYDNDGRLDLFVCQYVKLDTSIWCGNKLTGERWYCRPTVYKPTPSWLFHNNGDGTFTDVSMETGIAQSLGKALGVVAADINNDGWMDLFVGNDTEPNFLWANRGKGRFEEIGAFSGVGYNAFGLARSGMGVDAADYDQDGWIDLFISVVDREMFALYRNEGNEIFTDVAPAYGIASLTFLRAGMAVKFFDYDNDGNPDLIFNNGHPELNVAKIVPGITYEQPMMLLRNTGQGFQDVEQGERSDFFEADRGPRPGRRRLRQRRLGGRTRRRRRWRPLSCCGTTRAGKTIGSASASSAGNAISTRSAPRSPTDPATFSGLATNSAVVAISPPTTRALCWASDSGPRSTGSK